MSLQYRKGAKIADAVDFGASVTGVTYSSIGAMTLASLQLKVSAGTLTGTWEVQVTDDPRALDATLAPNADWVTIQSVAVDAATATNYMVSWYNAHQSCRYKWTFASNTGTGTVYLYGVSG